MSDYINVVHKVLLGALVVIGATWPATTGSDFGTVFAALFGYCVGAWFGLWATHRWMI